MDSSVFGLWDWVSRRVFRSTYTMPDPNSVSSVLRDTLVEREVALYIHIPFCTGRCLFCPYARVIVSRSVLDGVLEKYVGALVRELDLYSRVFRDIDVKVVDIHAGGGTPSLVPGRYWRIILDKLSEVFDVDPVIAIEGNPEDLRDEERVFDLVDNGVVEVSLGVQSFSQRKLRVLGRRHGVEDSIKAIDNLRNAGCRYINIDLMYMTPGETLEEWTSDLGKAVQMDVDEITCYPTLVTRHSIGYKLLRQGKLPSQPGMSVYKKMVYACEDILPAHGYKGVEIYGYSRVNGWKYVTVNYEMEGPLIAFGSGAMGFTGGFEYQNTCFPEEYIKTVNEGKLPIAGARKVSPLERAIRYIVTRLFICRKLDKTDFKKKHGMEFREFTKKTGFGKLLWFLKITGAIKEDTREIKLTRKGLYTAHKICWTFVLNIPCRLVEEYTKQPWPPEVTIP